MKTRLCCARSGGFTLVELLITIILVSIITSLAIPSFSDFIQKSQRHASVTQMISLINLARNTAIMEQQTITLCPLDEQNQCAHNWNGDITAFRDSNADKALSSMEEIIRVNPPSPGGRWEANTGSRPYFRFTPTGIANYAIGNMIWCPRSGDMTSSAQVIINMGGRVRLSKDSDGDGIAENSNGMPIKCS